MQKNSENFSFRDVAKLASSDAGKQLLRMLQQADPQVLQQITAHTQAGEYEKAVQLVTALTGQGQQNMPNGEEA